MSQRIGTTCAVCGVPFKFNKRRSKVCRACWLKEHTAPVCTECGVKLPAGTSSRTLKCWACWTKNAGDKCQDCGKLLPKGSHERTRCWDCWMKVRLAKEIKSCSVEDCKQPHRAKGLCLVHYQVQRRKFLAPAIDRPSRGLVATLSCIVCGYSDLPSEVHRPIAKGPYTVGNMVPLCANCHKKVHRGLIPCPPAWQPELDQVELLN